MAATDSAPTPPAPTPPAKPAPPAEPSAQGTNVERLSRHIEGLLDRQADLAIDSKLKTGG